MAKRRGKGEGTISQRADGRWQGRVNLGRNAQGRRQRKTVYAATRADVASKLNKLLGRVESGEPLQTSTPTLANWLNKWYRTHRRGWRPITRRIYRTAVDKWIGPTLGSVRIEKLYSDTIQAWIDGLTGDQPRPYVVTAHVVLSEALQHARHHRLITYNPADACTVPRPARKPITPLSREESQRLVDVARAHRLFALYVGTLTLGLRIGEVTGVRWSDLDLTAGSLSVVNQLQPIKPENAAKGDRPVLTLVELKTANSRRTLKLPALALAALKNHRVAQLAERLKAGAAWSNPNDLAFTHEDGRPLDPSYVRREFYGLLKAAGLERRRFHNLRHSNATLLLEAGTPLVEVSKALGHASLAITADTYSHFTPTIAQSVATRMDTVLKTGSDA